MQTARSQWTVRGLHRHLAGRHLRMYMEHAPPRDNPLAAVGGIVYSIGYPPWFVVLIQSMSSSLMRLLGMYRLMGLSSRMALRHTH